MSLKKRLIYRSNLIFLATTVFICAGSYLLYKYSTEENYRKKLFDIAGLAGEFYLEKDELNASTHKRIERRFNKIADETIRLYRVDDKTIYVDDELDNQLPDENIITKTVENYTYTFKKNNRVFVSLFYADNEGDFVIVVSGIDHQGAQSVHFLLQMFMLFGLIGIVIHILLSTMLAKRTFMPFKKLIKQVNSIKGDEWHIRLEHTTTGHEVDQFIKEFNYLLSRLEASFKVQKNFIKNTSHEIKTPLAIIIGDIEVALNQARTNAEYEEILSSLRTHSLHLKSIVESLFILSNLEVSPTKLSETLRIDEIIWEILERKRLEYPERLALVDFTEEAQQQSSYLSQSGNKYLLLIALGNIIDNAFKFSKDKDIKILFDVVSDKLVLQIIDFGQGIKPAESEQIFELFYRSTHNAEIAGHGIGLYLAKEIFKIHQIEINIESSHPSGTTFKLSFPAF